MDPKALKILMATFWTSGGWCPEGEQVTPPEDLLYARRAGFMFEPARRSHAEIVRDALEARANADPAAIASGFLASLSSRRLELRSALGSWAVLRHFPPHHHDDRASSCPVCGEYDRPGDDEDRNVLNFERYKWGGTRHEQPSYAAFDLALFRAAERPAPRPEDLALFRGVLGAIESAAPETSAAQLQARLNGTFPSNKGERECLINILGFCGILRTPGHPSFRSRFVPETERDDPSRRFVDTSYPACWWVGRDGIDREAVADFFPGFEL